ncbi:MAG TPA: hypothetical protein V6C84_06235 [Coleofasciculaceae cyanobacterium]|jgi:hypothetical protein
MTHSNLSILPASDRPSDNRSSVRRPTTAFQSESALSPAETEQSLNPESVLEFDWHKLTALGLSTEDAQKVAQTLVIKKVMFLYWRRLLRSGAPLDDARRIARAIAKYDTAKILPTAQQQQLIVRYCPFVCRSGLWRTELLLNASR